MFCGDLNGKEIQKKGIHFALQEKLTTLYSNYSPIKFFKKLQMHRWIDDRAIENLLDRKNTYTYTQTHTYEYTNIQTHTFAGFCFCFFLLDFCLFHFLFLAINLARSWLQARNWNQAPAMKVLSLNHWATREVPLSIFFICTLSLLFWYFFNFYFSPMNLSSG